MEPIDRLVFALDVKSAKRAEELAEQLSGRVGVLKVGLELFTREGLGMVKRLKTFGVPILLDLKLHDIPVTVARTCRVLRDLDLLGVTVHTAGGAAMLRGAAELMPAYGVTVLTSLDEEDLEADGHTFTPGQLVSVRAKRASKAGCQGIIASPLEVKHLRQRFSDLEVITPGIRVDTAHADQKRVATPANAIAWGADRIVVGRPIRDAPDPAAAADAIVRDIERGLKQRSES
jgi:orotidine-5'-phosphate decarboxylase